MSALIAWAGDYAVYLPLLGIVVLVLGFALRFNPMLAVPVAAITPGLLAGPDIKQVIAKLGKAFNDSRAIIIPWVVLPVIGLLERYGLQQRARAVISAFQAATVGRSKLAAHLSRSPVVVNRREPSFENTMSLARLFLKARTPESASQTPHPPNGGMPANFRPSGENVA